MAKFKVGNKVRLTRDYTPTGPYAGEIGVVTELVGEGAYFIRKGVASTHRCVDEDNWHLCVSEGSLELVTPEAYLCLCEDGAYIAHEGSLEDVPSDVVKVWAPGKEFTRKTVWEESNG